MKRFGKELVIFLFNFAEKCLFGEVKEDIEKIILTGSGGPFRTRAIDSFSTVTKSDALNHPNWEMGQKITIDSATMMNKGLEVIEAYWLFNLEISLASLSEMKPCP